MERYIFFGTLLVIILLLFSSFSQIRPDSSKDKGEVLFSWLSSNGMWFTTKFSIVGISLLLISPHFLSIQSNPLFLKWDITSLVSYLQTLNLEIKPFNTWTKGDLLFIILYVSILVCVVNIPIRYTITTSGISYRVLGIKVSFHSWGEVVCFDVSERPNSLLLIWFQPPVFQPDWKIHIPPKYGPKMINTLKDFAIHYNVTQHKTRKKKIFDLK